MAALPAATVAQCARAGRAAVRAAAAASTAPPGTKLSDAYPDRGLVDDIFAHGEPGAVAAAAGASRHSQRAVQLMPECRRLRGHACATPRR